MIYNFAVFNNYELTSYSICLLIGSILAYLYGFLLCKKQKLNISEYLYIFLFAIIGAGIGAKLLAIIQNLAIFNIVSFSDALYLLLRGGFSFFGGLFGYIIGIYIYAKTFKEDARQYFTILIFIIPLFLAIARVGCYLSGCCYGIESTSFLALPYNNINAVPPNAMRLPIALWDGLWCLFIIIIQSVYFKRKRFLHPAFIFILFYAVQRLILDQFRAEIAPAILNTQIKSQYICIFIIIGSIYLIIKQKTNIIIDYMNASKNE